MDSIYKTLTVNELINKEILYPPLDGNHGSIHPKSSDFLSSGIPFLMASDLIHGNISLDTCSFISEIQAKNLKKGFAREGDVLLSHKATIGRTALIKSIETDYVVLTPQITYYRIKDKKNLNNHYLKYYFDSPYFQRTLSAWADGSTRKYIGITAQRDLPVILPDIKNQIAISEILSSLDNKIENNLVTNKTLEKIAKTLFKSWFINFDPVRAKAEGRSSGLSKEISSLFPDSFEDSELGEIPKGWKVGSLNEIIVRSKEKIKDTNSRVLAAVSSGELVLSEEYFSKQVFSKDISKYIKVEQYDFAYNPSRINIGSIGMNEYDFIGAVSPVYIVFKPLTHWHLFVSQFIRLKSTNSKINQLSSGSVRQSLSFDDFASIPITIPTDVTNMKFNEIYESLRRKIIQNQEECEILTSLRDTLLPKLISGELKIPDAKNLVEEAGV